MTIEQVSFRDFIRGAIPSDILQFLDKCTNKSKGVFVSSKYNEKKLNLLIKIEA